MRHFRLNRLIAFIAAAALAAVPRPAIAVVIFEEDFAARAHGTGMFGQQPIPINVGNSFFVRSQNLAGDTLGRIGHYGDQSLGIKGLLFEPRDVGSENKSTQHAQNMSLPYQYSFGTDKVRLTVVARTYDPYDNDGVSFWNNFAFGFTDTDQNLSNFILLKRNPNNEARTHAQIFNNSKIYQTNLPRLVPAPAPTEPTINAERFRELTLEYDPTKLNISGVNPFKIIVDGTEYSLGSRNNVGPGIDCSNVNNPSCPADVGLPAMTTDGGQSFNNIRGIGWGFWQPNEIHPTDPDPQNPSLFLPKSVLIESMKFEIIPQSVSQPGDENGDGTVDARDYIVWRKRNGSETDYNTWRANFGAGSGLGGSAASAAVPEPAAGMLLLVGLLVCGTVRRESARARGRT